MLEVNSENNGRVLRIIAYYSKALYGLNCGRMVKNNRNLNDIAAVRMKRRMKQGMVKNPHMSK